MTFEAQRARTENASTPEIRTVILQRGPDTAWHAAMLTELERLVS